jgi:hypothetical protein
MRALLRIRGQDDALREYYVDYRDRHGVRPTALETFHDGYTPRSVRRTHGSWLRFVESMGDLSPAQQAVLGAARGLLEEIDVTRMVRSYKMVLLTALLNANAIPGTGIRVDQLMNEVRRVVQRSGKLREDFGVPIEQDSQLRALLVQNPISAWVDSTAVGGTSLFDYTNDIFRFIPAVHPEAKEPFQTLLRELVEWRLAEYLARNSSSSGFTMKLSHTGGRPMFFLPDRSMTPGIPEGWQEITIDGDTYEANFVKVALNVIRRRGGEENVLPKIVRSWFGPDAGRPGTDHRAKCEHTEQGYVLTPANGGQSEHAELWKKYSREQIPRLFGEEFSEAYGTQGLL